MKNLLLWECVPQTQALGLPMGFLTFGPGFFASDAPLEALSLLPSGPCSTGLLDWVAEHPDRARGFGIGLFLNDPFLSDERILATLRRAGTGWICNLPSLAQHETSFRADIEEVGYSHRAELERLARLREAGIRTMAVISSSTPLDPLFHAPSDAVLVVQDTAEMAPTFPPLAQRKSQRDEVAHALRKSGMDGPVLYVAQRNEDLSDPVLLRPRAL